MNNKLEKNPLRSRVVEKIKSGEIKMRPKSYFILKGGLVIFGIFIIFIISLFIASLVAFYLRASGALLLPIFGLGGLKFFLFSLPWILILVSLFFVIVLEMFVRNFSFAYHRPLIYSFLIVALLIVGGGVVVAKTSLHTALYNSAQEGHLPFVGAFYQNQKALPPGADIGIVSTSSEGIIEIKTQKGQNLKVIISPKASFPNGKNIEAGDKVMVAGEKEDSTIKAFGVRKMEEFPDDFLRRAKIRKLEREQIEKGD
ncbi:MAG: hypothetical protein HY764_00495 [Candidatus Portnoybacteria bacterium]|nr:hypothetical protein [Candidatus Portnoybacteria bacterium]